MSRVSAAALTELAAALLAGAGLAARHAACYAEKILAADLLGHGSHGIRLLPRSLDELQRGDLAGDGDPEVVADHGASLLVDGRMLPGPVVVVHAVDRALARISSHGAVVVSIRRSGHIAALCTYLEMATSRGLMMLIVSSNPWARLVAPFGGVKPVYSPNPIAFGFPTPGDPVLMDFSTSAIAANAVQEYRARGEALPGPYLLDADGRPTDDPHALSGDRPGSILPLGGVDLGHKGFGLGLMVEALTAGLSGYGRSSAPPTTNNAVFVMLARPPGLRRPGRPPRRGRRPGRRLPGGRGLRRGGAAARRAGAGASPSRVARWHRDRRAAAGRAPAPRVGARRQPTRRARRRGAQLTPRLHPEGLKDVRARSAQPRLARDPQRLPRAPAGGVPRARAAVLPLSPDARRLPDRDRRVPAAGHVG